MRQARSLARFSSLKAPIYIPDVAGEQQAIDFRITSIDERCFVAVNPENDFPKLICYELVQMNDGKYIVAAIEGNGKVIPYRFQRLNNHPGYGILPFDPNFFTL